jgi:hypothetical protein
MAIPVPGVTVRASAWIATMFLLPGAGTVWVRARDAAGNWGPAAGLEVVVNGVVPGSVPELPREFALGPVIPNPVAGPNRVTYGLPASAELALAVYDVAGRRVRSLVAGRGDPGVHTVTWDRRDDAGRLVGAGVYYYRLAVAGRRFVRRVAVLP